MRLLSVKKFTNSIKRFMGIIAELLVRDKLITFDEFKAIGTRQDIWRSLFAYGMKVYIYV